MYFITFKTLRIYILLWFQVFDRHDKIIKFPALYSRQYCSQFHLTFEFNVQVRNSRLTFIELFKTKISDMYTIATQKT